MNTSNDNTGKNAPVVPVMQADAVSIDPKARMTMFQTRNRANTARRVYLRDPATGEQTSEYLDILSGLSDAFTQARAVSQQEAMSIQMIRDPAAKEAARRTSQLTLQAALIAGWSFAVDCTVEERVAFLREAPQLSDVILNEADNAEAFFGKPSGN